MIRMRHIRRLKIANRVATAASFDNIWRSAFMCLKINSGFLKLKFSGFVLAIVFPVIIASFNVYADQDTNQSLLAKSPEIADPTKSNFEGNSPLQTIIKNLELNLTKTNLDANTRRQLEATLKHLQGLANSQSQVQRNWSAAIKKGVLPPMSGPEKVPGSPWVMSASTNLPDTNFIDLNVVDQTSNSPALQDAIGKWLFQTIDSTKRDLEKPGLDANSRQLLEWKLKHLQGQMADHQTQVESNMTIAAAMRSDPKTAFTNMQDPISQSWSLTVAQNERELADPALNPYRRQALEIIMANAKQQLADHQTNAQLWANLVQAQLSRNSEQVASSQAKLADYLGSKLGKIQGKTYPQGMSLDAIMDEYRKQGNGSHWFDSRTVIRTIIFTVFLLPPLVMLFMAIRKRASK